MKTFRKSIPTEIPKKKIKSLITLVKKYKELEYGLKRITYLLKKKAAKHQEIDLQKVIA